MNEDYELWLFSNDGQVKNLIGGLKATLKNIIFVCRSGKTTESNFFNLVPPTYLKLLAKKNYSKVFYSSTNSKTTEAVCMSTVRLGVQEVPL